MSIVLVGSNPGLLLFDAEQPVATASVWSVEWSVWGSGTILMAADADGWRTVGADKHLAKILLETFNRHFPESEAFADTSKVRHTDDEVDLTCDLQSGLEASGGGIELRLGDVRDRRPFADPAFPLGGLELGLTNVYAPCGFGELVIDGTVVRGRPAVSSKDGRWTSTAFLAVAEVWTDPDGALQLTDARQLPSPKARPRRQRHLRAIHT